MDLPDRARIDDLVAQARAGDLAAFGRLVECCDREVRLFVAARAPSVEVMEEAVQAAFVTAWERLAAFEPRGHFANWVKGIAHNHLRDELRRRQRLVAVDATAIEDLLAGCDDDDGDDPLADFAPHLPDCLAGLSAQARALVAARYGEGLDLAELAARVAVEPGAVAVRLHRIRQTLKACIERRAAGVA